MRIAAALLTCALAAPGAAAVPFPARTGESGLLDVPDADIGQGAFAAELRLDHRGARRELGPLPLYLGTRLGSRAELGLSMREGGQPGDPLPARPLFAGALKLNLVDGARAAVSVAVDGYADRINAGPVRGARALASTSDRWPARLTAFAGYEWGGRGGPTWGGAVALPAGRDTDVVLEALNGPRGANVGAALRRRVSANVPAFLSFNYFPGDQAWRVGVGFTFAPPRPDASAGPERPAAPTETPAPDGPSPRPRDERPRFRLRVHAAGEEPRSLRYGPDAALAAIADRRAAAPAPSAAPSPDDLADAELRPQEERADARERRARSAGMQLDVRDATAAEAQLRADQRERTLAARAQQLDARERPVIGGATPGTQQRELEALEAQLAARERTLAARELGFGPAIGAAAGRERDAVARQEAEGAEASRLAAVIGDAPSRAQAIVVRKQALAARNRHLTAYEAASAARGERLDAQEQQLRARGERLDAWGHRLDIRDDRVELLETLPAEAPAPPRSARTATPVANARPRLVMVAKAPTAVVEDRAGTGADVAAEGVASALRETGGPRAATGSRPGVHAVQLEPGEGGRRQLREAMQAARSSVEPCVAELMERRGLVRAEAVLALTVSATGKVVKVVPADGDLAEGPVGGCLASAAAGWLFPASDAGYAVQIPIVVIRGGAR